MRWTYAVVFGVIGAFAGTAGGNAIHERAGLMGGVVGASLAGLLGAVLGGFKDIVEAVRDSEPTPPRPRPPTPRLPGE